MVAKRLHSGHQTLQSVGTRETFHQGSQKYIAPDRRTKIAILGGTLIPSSKVFALIAALAAPFSVPAAHAQTAGKAPPTPKPAPVSEDPELTTASYGDWVVRCQRVGEGEKAVKTCEAAQTIQPQGQTAPMAEYALARGAPSDPLRLTVILPPNIALPSNVRLVADDKDDAGVDLEWRRCIPGGCVADLAPDADTLKHWRALTGSGKLSFKNAGARLVTVPFSFRGLAQALDSLAKGSRPQPPAQ